MLLSSSSTGNMKLFHLFHSRLSDLIIIIIIAWPPKTRQKKKQPTYPTVLNDTTREIMQFVHFTSFHLIWRPIVLFSLTQSESSALPKNPTCDQLFLTFSRGEINQLSRRSRSNEIENRQRRHHACRPNSSKMRRVNKTEIFFIFGVPSWNSNRLLKILFEEKKAVRKKVRISCVATQQTSSPPEWCYSAMLIEILRWHLMDKKNICYKFRVPYRIVSVKWFSCVWWRFSSVNCKQGNQ